MTSIKHFHEFENRIEWYTETGILHREDGPAVEWINGTKEWYQMGQCHREDGPAIEDTEENLKEWWIRGVRISFHIDNINLDYFDRTLIYVPIR
jgi:hypothetical protein